MNTAANKFVVARRNWALALAAYVTGRSADHRPHSDAADALRELCPGWTPPAPADGADVLWDEGAIGSADEARMLREASRILRRM